MIELFVAAYNLKPNLELQTVLLDVSKWIQPKILFRPEIVCKPPVRVLAQTIATGRFAHFHAVF